MAGKRIGLFFGSFNPIHNGHLMIANYIAEFEMVDQVWFVISPLNPFKTGTEILADYHRRELLMRAVGDYPGFRVSSVEFKLPKPSYTIDTLEFLSKEYPESQFLPIMGSDQLPDFGRWKNPEKILSEYKILVYPRSEERKPKGMTCDTKATDSDGFPLHASRFTLHEVLSHPSIKLIHAPLMEISSTFIRNSIKEGKDVRFYMPELTWTYIEEMHFYR